jgi:hypothetical protein
VGLTEATSDAADDVGTVGIVGGVLLLAILLVAYYAGAYVAGRMARFTGLLSPRLAIPHGALPGSRNPRRAAGRPREARLVRHPRQVAACRQCVASIVISSSRLVCNRTELADLPVAAQSQDPGDSKPATAILAHHVEDAPTALPSLRAHSATPEPGVIQPSATTLLDSRAARQRTEEGLGTPPVGHPDELAALRAIEVLREPLPELADSHISHVWTR